MYSACTPQTCRCPDLLLSSHVECDLERVLDACVLWTQASDTATADSEHYFFPRGPAAQAALDRRWQELTAVEAEHPAVPLELTVMFGRQLQVMIAVKC